MEQSISDIKDQLVKHEDRMGRMEERISTAEDTQMHHRRALRYLLHRDIEISTRCDDHQNRLRRNNIRIFQIPEDSEKLKDHFTVQEGDSLCLALKKVWTDLSGRYQEDTIQEFLEEVTAMDPRFKPKSDRDITWDRL